MKSRKAAGVIVFCFLGIFSTHPAFAQTVSETEIIFDASGSMNETRGNGTKLDMAKDALWTIAEKIPEGSKVGLRIFGTNPVEAKGNVVASCQDSKLPMPIAPFHRKEMIRNVASVESYGMTAIGYSLELAGKDFSQGANVKKNIILISDGEETCDKDPIAVLKALKAQGMEFTVHAIGFTASDKAKAQLKNLSEMTGGTYREAEDTASLQDSLEASVEQTLLLKPKNEFSGENILAAANGAQIVSADKDLFANLIDGSEERVGHFSYSDAAIFSFKDNRPVLLQKFLVPVFEKADSNMGKIILYGSTDQPESGFFQITDFQVENKVAFGNVYQEFKIDPPGPFVILKWLWENR